jgi:FkbM family methyltransferase
MVLTRLIREFRGLQAVLDGPSFARYSAAALANAAEIARSRSLVAADRQMRRPVRVHTWRDDLVVDCGLIDRRIGDFDPTLTFSAVRELCCRDVYFRAFEPFTARGQVVLDLGANRGLFSALAAAALEPARIVAVEPQDAYLAAFQELTRAAKVEITRVGAFVGTGPIKDMLLETHPDVPTTSPAELVGPGERIAFIKVDIEGAEESLIDDGGPWLDRVERIALEAHPGQCDTPSVHEALKRAGLTVVAADHLGDPAPPGDAEFMYGARSPDYLRARYRGRN